MAELDADERVHEVARMLGGDPESAVSLQHARELLERAGGLPEPEEQPRLAV